MSKDEWAQLEVWARERFESIAPELANFGLTDIAFNNPRMGFELLREPKMRHLPDNGEAHFGVENACRRASAPRLRPLRCAPRTLRRYSRRV